MEIQFKWEENNYQKSLKELPSADGIFLFEIRIRFPEKCVPKKTRLSFGVDARDMFSTWSPQAGYERGLRSDMHKSVQPSRSASGAPVKTIVSASDRNRLTAAVKDYKTPIALLSGIREEDAKLYIDIDFFTNPIGELEEYTTVIRLDMRDIPYYEAVYAVREWWLDGKKPYIPQTARYPMYSTWYSYHQQFDPQALLEECKIASELGMKAIILDDGWQTKDAHRGYAFCGDWQSEPEKVGDMAQLVRGVHALGMKLILWYSVPFVGKNSSVWERFCGMYLDSEERQWCRLDPRFPAVRDYLIGLYKKAAVEWGIDGFKLDFIDSFELFEESMAPRAGQDIVSLEDAVQKLLEDAMKELRAINPEICIEFRQSYMGPLMQTYGNMIRVSDCPADPLTNRLGSIDLRLTSGGCAVHSDMLMWHVSDSAEGAARQLLNVLFAVPQISVRLGELPKEQLQMLRFYLDFWIRHREVLLDGSFTPLQPEQNYALAAAEKDGIAIAVNYGQSVYECAAPLKKLIVINAGSSGAVYVDFSADCGSGRAEVYDCRGNRRACSSIKGLGTLKIDTPLCGMSVLDFTV